MGAGRKREAQVGRVAGARLAGRAGLLAGAAFLGGCSHLPHPHWPWDREARVPEPVQELDESSSTGAASFPQSWKRNTLLVDLTSASGTGSLTLTPRAGTSWPVRIALRVRPGSIGELEVVGAQRVLLPISAQAGAAGGGGAAGSSSAADADRSGGLFSWFHGRRARQGGDPTVDLELPPGSFRLRTPQITVNWGPALPVPELPPVRPAQTSGPGAR